MQVTYVYKDGVTNPFRCAINACLWTRQAPFLHSLSLRRFKVLILASPGPFFFLTLASVVAQSSSPSEGTGSWLTRLRESGFISASPKMIDHLLVTVKFQCPDGEFSKQTAAPCVCCGHTTEIESSRVVFTPLLISPFYPVLVRAFVVVNTSQIAQMIFF